MGLYFWGLGLALGVAAALLLASWIIVRQGRTNLALANLQRLVALERQTFIDELNAISDDVAGIAVTAVSAKKFATSIGNAVIVAIRKIETRLDTMQDRIEARNSNDDKRNQQADASDERRLRFTIDRISKSQRLLEERFSDDIRFNLERAKIADASLKGLVNRMEAVSQRLNRLVDDYDGLFASVGLLKGVGHAPPALMPQDDLANVSSERELVPAKSNLSPGAPSSENLNDQSSPSAEPTHAGVGYPSDEAA